MQTKSNFIITTFLTLIIFCVKAQYDEPRQFEFSYCKSFGDTIDYAYLKQGATLNLFDKNFTIESFVLVFRYKDSENKYIFKEIPIKGNTLNCEAIDALNELEILKKDTEYIQKIKIEAVKASKNGTIVLHKGYDFSIRFP